MWERPPQSVSIPASNIGDTDGDGASEILDGWGRPLGFVRWPVGYNDLDSATTINTPSNGLVDKGPDDFDLFQSDFAYTDLATAAQVADVTSGATRNPWSMRPLIVSAGSDGDFGIALNPHSSNGEQVNFDYTDPSTNSDNAMANWLNPTTGSATLFGIELPGRTGGYMMVDPYLRRFAAANGGSTILPGQELSLRDRSDNITNYSLQAGR